MTKQKHLAMHPSHTYTVVSRELYMLKYIFQPRKFNYFALQYFFTLRKAFQSLSSGDFKHKKTCWVLSMAWTYFQLAVATLTSKFGRFFCPSSSQWEIDTNKCWPITEEIIMRRVSVGFSYQIGVLEQGKSTSTRIQNVFKNWTHIEKVNILSLNISLFSHDYPLKGVLLPNLYPSLVSLFITLYYCNYTNEYAKYF